MKSVFTMELEKMAKNLLKKYEHGCGELVFENGINEFGQGDKMVCGTFWAGRTYYCKSCREIVDNCKECVKDVKDEVKE